MATQRAEMRIEQSDARRTRGRPDTSWQRLLAVGAGAVVASAIANVVIAGALDEKRGNENRGEKIALMPVGARPQPDPG